jgi:hypothetical protein
MTRYAFVEAISRDAAVRRASSPGLHSLRGSDARFARRRPGSDLPRTWPGWTGIPDGTGEAPYCFRSCS